MEKEYEYRIKVTYDEGDEFWVMINRIFDSDVYRLTRFDQNCEKFYDYNTAKFHMQKYKEQNNNNNDKVEIVMTLREDIIDFEVGPKIKKISENLKQILQM